MIEFHPNLRFANVLGDMYRQWSNPTVGNPSNLSLQTTRYLFYHAFWRTPYNTEVWPNINRFQCNRQSTAKVKFALLRERWSRNDHRFVAGTRQLEKTIYEFVIFSYISIDLSRFLVSYVTFVPPEYTQL